MIQNIGKLDRRIRMIAGIAIIAVGFLTGSWWGAIGILPILTAAIGWCPPYSLLGINTCKYDRQES
jgi:hypothetical protein